MLAAELERIRAISDDEERFQAAQDVLYSLRDLLNPAAAEIRGGAALALHEARGWTYDEIGDRFVLKKAAVQRIINEARDRAGIPRKRQKRRSDSGAAGSAGGAK